MNLGVGLLLVGEHIHGEQEICRRTTEHACYHTIMGQPRDKTGKGDRVGHESDRETKWIKTIGLAIRKFRGRAVNRSTGSYILSLSTRSSLGYLHGNDTLTHKGASRSTSKRQNFHLKV